MDSTHQWEFCTSSGARANQTLSGPFPEGSHPEAYPSLKGQRWRWRGQQQPDRAHRHRGVGGFCPQQPASACARVRSGANTMWRVSRRRGLSEIRATCPANTVKCRQSARTCHKPNPRQIKPVDHLRQY